MSDAQLEREVRTLLGLDPPRLALILPCGGKKVDETVRVNELYTGPLWKTYRDHSRLDDRGRNVDMDVYVLSAEHGLMPEDRAVCPYDRVLVKDAYSKQRKGGTPVARVKDLVATVRRQAKRYGLADYETVIYEGSRQGNPYYDLLQRAGIPFRVLRGQGKGIGYYRSNLKRFLLRFKE